MSYYLKKNINASDVSSHKEGDDLDNIMGYSIRDLNGVSPVPSTSTFRSGQIDEINDDDMDIKMSHTMDQLYVHNGSEEPSIVMAEPANDRKIFDVSKNPIITVEPKNTMGISITGIASTSNINRAITIGSMEDPSISFTRLDAPKSHPGSGSPCSTVFQKGKLHVLDQGHPHVYVKADPRGGKQHEKNHHTGNYDVKKGGKLQLKFNVEMNTGDHVHAWITSADPKLDNLTTPKLCTQRVHAHNKQAQTFLIIRPNLGRYHVNNITKGNVQIARILILNPRTTVKFTVNCDSENSIPVSNGNYWFHVRIIRGGVPLLHQGFPMAIHPSLDVASYSRFQAPSWYPTDDFMRIHPNYLMTNRQILNKIYFESMAKSVADLTEEGLDSLTVKSMCFIEDRLEEMGQDAGPPIGDYNEQELGEDSYEEDSDE